MLSIYFYREYILQFTVVEGWLGRVQFFGYTGDYDC